MPEQKNIAIAMSGGVDSSVAAYLISQKYPCAGVTMILGQNKAAAQHDVESAQHTCKVLGIQHHVIDLSKDFFREIVCSFVEDYANAQTPNPCIRCNERIKFGALEVWALAHGYSHVATGHYVRIHKTKDGLFELLRGVDIKKDQSYFLYRLTQTQLTHALFPLGSMTKQDVRHLAFQAGLPHASRPESQDICFTPNGNLVDFLNNWISGVPGPILDTAGNRVGTHDGLVHYTLGQRKGLGVSLGHPAYVCNIDPNNNSLTLGDQESILVHDVYAHKINWILDNLEEHGFPLHCTAKVRYNMHDVACVVSLEDGRIHATFADPIMIPSPGQSIVFYKDDTVLGGGIVD